MTTNATEARSRWPFLPPASQFGHSLADTPTSEPSNGDATADSADAADPVMANDWLGPAANSQRRFRNPRRIIT
jgi:hypothetical protein